MPVTIRLSQKLYEKLGEDVANELVNWFNAVDTTYRGELRDVNESNFARFDAKLEQRLTALRSDLDTKWTERWTALDAKFDQRIADVRAEVRAGLATLKGELVAEMGNLRGELNAQIARAQSTTVKWMFGFWAPTAVGIVGTALGVVALLLRR
jgi:2-succinyl-5-enolpyruvyl-6-hydroxy-3-cyclohexene-1-carboxylate synthase